mmetsp:Transcript_101740/g.283291  ORF Transcript_101740/g.283291 Transcript_101740/m.283291 type:complete len:217 (-) Transcript_101740:117-767(-)
MICSPCRSLGPPACLSLNHRTNPGEAADQPWRVHAGATNLARVSGGTSDGLGRSTPVWALQMRWMESNMRPLFRVIDLSSSPVRAGQPFKAPSKIQRPSRRLSPRRSSETLSCGTCLRGFSSPDSVQCFGSWKLSGLIVTYQTTPSLAPPPGNWFPFAAAAAPSAPSGAAPGASCSTSSMPSSSSLSTLLGRTSPHSAPPPPHASTGRKSEPRRSA